MKFRFFALIVGIFIICPFASPVNGDMIKYYDLEVLSAIVDNYLAIISPYTKELPSLIAATYGYVKNT